MMRGATLGDVLWLSFSIWLGIVAGGFLGIVLFACIDISFRLIPSEPPFQFVEPMLWTGLVAAAVGGWLGGWRALLDIRRNAAARVQK
jgi:hypothetical protein